jgi:hypothetical protein
MINKDVTAGTRLLYKIRRAVGFAIVITGAALLMLESFAMFPL